MTSPIRSGAIFGLRRISSRTTLTAMSSARVFQKHVHSIRDAVELGVLPREPDSGRARVGCPNLDFRAIDRQRNRHRAAAGADVGGAYRNPVDSLEGLFDEPLRRRSRSEHLS